jgi:hypothetical protein
MPAPDPLPPSKGDDDNPGVPFFRTWRALYAFVIVCFIIVVVVLAVFSHVYA